MKIISLLKNAWYWILKIKNSNKVIFYTVITSVIFIFSIVGIYIFYFWDRKIGNPSDFANFATYFGNMTMPILTSGTIIILYMTFKHQQDLLKLELKKTKRSAFDVHIRIFNESMDKFDKWLERPVGGDTTEDSVILRDIKTLQPGSKEAKNAGKIIDKNRRLMDDFHKGKLEGNDPEITIALYFIELAHLIGEAARTLHSSYQYASIEDMNTLRVSHDRVMDAVFELASWNVLSSSDSSNFEAMLRLPTKEQLPD